MGELNSIYIYLGLLQVQLIFVTAFFNEKKR